MTDKRFNLVSVTVIRPGGRYHYATLWEALNSFRPWVALGEGQRIFERVFFLG
jgi:hypothetical protein